MSCRNFFYNFPIRKSDTGSNLLVMAPFGAVGLGTYLWKNSPNGSTMQKTGIIMASGGSSILGLCMLFKLITKLP